MLGLFINTLTADVKYSRRNIENVLQQIQTPLSQKQKTFWILYCICAIYMKFRTFWKKDESPSLIISEIIDCKIGGYLNV